MRKTVIILLISLGVAAFILDRVYRDSRPTVWPNHSELHDYAQGRQCDTIAFDTDTTAIIEIHGATGVYRMRVRYK